MTDPDNVPHYSSNVVDYELVSGEKQEVGRTCRWVVKVAGRRLEMTDEMVEVERGRGGKYISRNAPIPYTLWVHCEDAGGGTKVTCAPGDGVAQGILQVCRPGRTLASTRVTCVRTS